MMKLKDLQGFPEKKELSENDPSLEVGYNQALSELGELEVLLDVLTVNNILEKHTDILSTATMTRGEALMNASQEIANSKEVVRIKENNNDR